MVAVSVGCEYTVMHAVQVLPSADDVLDMSEVCGVTSGVYVFSSEWGGRCVVERIGFGLYQSCRNRGSV